MKSFTFLKTSLWILFAMFLIRLALFISSTIEFIPEILDQLLTPSAITSFVLLLAGMIGVIYSARQTTWTFHRWNMVNVAIGAIGFWQFVYPFFDQSLYLFNYVLPEIFSGAVPRSMILSLVVSIIGALASTYLLIVSLLNLKVTDAFAYEQTALVQGINQNMTKISTARGNFWLDILISLGVGALIFFSLPVLVNNSPEDLYINAAIIGGFIFMLILDIKSGIIEKAKLFTQAQTAVKISKTPYVLTSISLLSSLIVTWTYAMVCTGKFCGIMFVISLFPIGGAVIAGIIYSLASPYPRKYIIFSLLLFATSIVLFMD